MEYSFNDKAKCLEIAKNGDWLLDALPSITVALTFDRIDP